MRSPKVAMDAPTKTVSDNPSKISPATNSGDTNRLSIVSSARISKMRLNDGGAEMFHQSGIGVWENVWTGLSGFLESGC
jgi:hypothetical protein